MGDINQIETDICALTITVFDVYREESRPEKSRNEPCGTPIETAGQQALSFDTLSTIREVVGEPARQSFEKPRLLSLPIRM